MEFTYEEGRYLEGAKKISGEIILSEHKLYLRDAQGEIAASFVPLEKIIKVKKEKNALKLFVRLSITNDYTAVIEGKASRIKELLKDLIVKRGFKKRFLINEWVEDLS